MSHENGAAMQRSSMIAFPSGHSQGNIRVAVRVRPFSAQEEQVDGGAEPILDLDALSENTIVTKPIDKYGFESDYAKERKFGFDCVFNSIDRCSASTVSQAQVFEEIGVPILENALDAYNGCLLAYGQTGAGKSHSVLGDLRSDAGKGLLPRSCERLFEMVDRRLASAEEGGSPLRATIFASYLEIYQEKMFDLLVSTTTRTDLQVRIHPSFGPHVPSLTQTPVQNIREIKDLIDFGAKNRAVSATTMNANSSRSHTVFTIDLRLSVAGSQPKDLQSKIHFVDLAGSEKQKKAHASGDRLLEGISINQSLSTLSRVIHALASGGERNSVLAPFRESKLTLLLKDALSGNSRTVLLACISPSKYNLEESLSTLEFAARCKLVKTNAKKNEEDKRSLIDSISAQKREIEERLNQEVTQRRLLQDELEREVEQSRRSHEEVKKIKKQFEKAREQGLCRRAEELRQREVDEEELRRELKDLQSLSDSLSLEKQDLERRAQEQKQNRDQLLREIGILGAEPEIQVSRMAPRLVNLHPDPMLEGCLIYYLSEDETRIGADQQRCHVCLKGLEIGDEACAISHSRGAEGFAKLHVWPLSGGLIRVNGAVVPESGHALQNGDRLAIGRAHIFRVDVPSGRRRSEIERDEQHFDRAFRELQEFAEVDPRWRRGIDSAALTVKRDYGTREANALLDAAKAASEAVAEANAILRSIPHTWSDGISHYELAVLFEADGPPVVCVVGRRANSSASAMDSASPRSRHSGGIWEATRFVDDRLPHLHQAAEHVRLRSSLPHEICGDEDGGIPRQVSGHRHALPNGPQVGDWESKVWSEIGLAEYRGLAQRLLDLRQHVSRIEHQAARPCGTDDSSNFWIDYSHEREPSTDTTVPSSVSPRASTPRSESGSQEETCLPSTTNETQSLEKPLPDVQAVETTPRASSESAYVSQVDAVVPDLMFCPPPPEPFRIEHSETILQNMPQGTCESGLDSQSPKEPLVAVPILPIAKYSDDNKENKDFDTVTSRSQGTSDGTRCSHLKGCVSSVGKCNCGCLKQRRSSSLGSLSKERRRTTNSASSAEGTPRAEKNAEKNAEKAIRRSKRGLGRNSSLPAVARDSDSNGSAGLEHRRADENSLLVRDNDNFFSSKKLGNTLKKKAPLELSAAETHLRRRSLDAKLPLSGNRGSETDVVQREFVEIRVDTLFDGRLGVRLRMEGLVVSGFDFSEAADVGWRLRDEICAINGIGVQNKQDFSRELTSACRELPIIFTVARYPSSSPYGARSL